MTIVVVCLWLAGKSKRVAEVWRGASPNCLWRAWSTPAEAQSQDARPSEPTSLPVTRLKKQSI